MLIRQTAPVFGAASKLVPEKGEWQVSLSYRGLESDDHYSGTEHQRLREREGTYVVNTQQALDLGVSYSASDRLSFTLGIPVVKSSWAVPTPIRPVPGPRAEQEASGLGDISLTGRYWAFAPESRHNVSLGLGVKAPTGEYDAAQVYPNIDGTNPSLKAVDQSVQPGDGGWGVLFDVQAFRQFRRATLFASGTYLANPRDTNGTPSIIVGLGLANSPGFAEEGLLVNSVPDQYLVRMGAVMPVGKTGLGVSLAYRVEGLPRYDLIGDSHGWRRPGHEMFVEPGIAYSKGGSTWSLNVPIGFYRNRQPNPYSGREGDATFPDYILLTSLSQRF
ncbi:MAG TPA: transporter [Thermoanaerobaculia bacterium]|nr:transporter [Thermoanaerobaculia bacterium]